MTLHLDRGGMPKAMFVLLVMGGMLALAIVPGPINAQEKPKTEAKDQKKADAKSQAKDEKKAEAKPQPKPEKKAEAKPQPKAEKKAEVKPAPAPAPAPPPPNPNDPAKLKEQITALQKEVAMLKLKVATLELEKLGAMVTVDKAKDGKETATVNILKKWSGDKDALQLLKNVPNLQVVYIDNGQVNDAAVSPAQGPDRLECAHLDEPSAHRRGARSSQGADQPDDAVLDQLESWRQGATEPQGAQKPSGPCFEPHRSD